MRGAIATGVAALALMAMGGRALADEGAAGKRERHVPIAENFSLAERVTIVTVTAGGVFALAAAPRLFDPAAPSFGPPAPGSFDRSISNGLYSDDGTGSRFLGRVPDVAGLYVLPYLPALYYGFETYWTARTDRPLRPGGDLNADHRLWAYVEALGWTVLITGVTKMVVGRQRPYAVLGHPALAGPAAEENVSFFSSHSSAVFCAATFVSLDLSAWLTERVLRDAGTARRVMLGKVVPYTVAFGVAGLVAISRIIDQQHWATDVLVGAAVGTAAAELAYLVHFDSSGQPRRRHALTVAPMVGLGSGPGSSGAAPSGIVLAGVLP